MKASVTFYNFERHLVELALGFSWAPIVSAHSNLVHTSCQITLLEGFVPASSGASDVSSFQALLKRLDGPLFLLAGKSPSQCRYTLRVKGPEAHRVPGIQDALPSLMKRMHAKGITVAGVVEQAETEDTGELRLISVD